MANKKLFGIFIISLFFSLVVVAYYYFRFIPKLEIISDNPDLIFEGKWPEEYTVSVGNLTFLSMRYSDFFYPWYGEAEYFPEEIPKGSGKRGIIIIHPQSVNVPSFVAQNITLSYLDDERYILVAEIANLADYFGSCPQRCADVIIKIKIIDISSRQEENVYEDVIDSKEGWQTITLDISKYRGKSIIFRIEGHAGGPCHVWCGEWAAVNKFYISKVTT